LENYDFHSEKVGTLEKNLISEMSKSMKIKRPNKAKVQRIVQYSQRFAGSDAVKELNDHLEGCNHELIVAVKT